jgi:hypothetical protein
LIAFLSCQHTNVISARYRCFWEPLPSTLWEEADAKGARRSQCELVPIYRFELTFAFQASPSVSEADNDRQQEENGATSPTDDPIQIADTEEDEEGNEVDLDASIDDMDDTMEEGEEVEGGDSGEAEGEVSMYEGESMED